MKNLSISKSLIDEILIDMDTPRAAEFWAQLDCDCVDLRPIAFERVGKRGVCAVTGKAAVVIEFEFFSSVCQK